MECEHFLGLNEIQISFLGALGQVILSIAALFIAIINLKILKRLNVVDSMRWINDKFTDLNYNLLSDEENIKLDPLIPKKNKSSKAKINNVKRSILIYNHLNILELVYLEMKYKTLKKKHGDKILSSFIPDVVNDEELEKMLKENGYDEEFVRYCMGFKK